jgi:hypothetical protein
MACASLMRYGGAEGFEEFDASLAGIRSIRSADRFAKRPHSHIAQHRGERGKLIFDLTTRARRRRPGLRVLLDLRSSICMSLGSSEASVSGRRVRAALLPLRDRAGVRRANRCHRRIETATPLPACVGRLHDAALTGVLTQVPRNFPGDVVARRALAATPRTRQAEANHALLCGGAGGVKPAHQKESSLGMRNAGSGAAGERSPPAEGCTGMKRFCRHGRARFCTETMDCGIERGIERVLTTRALSSRGEELCARGAPVLGSGKAAPRCSGTPC